jgi:molybdopterin converting factor small subunit
VKVEVQLFATLTAYMPPGTHGDRITCEVPDGATVADVLRSFQIPSELDYLIVANGVEVPPDHRLADRDVLSLFPPLAGG